MWYGFFHTTFVLLVKEYNMSTKIKIRVYDINWDTNNNNDDLPKEVIIEESKEMLDDFYRCGESIIDYLSENYGCHVNGFQAKPLRTR